MIHYRFGSAGVLAAQANKNVSTRDDQTSVMAMRQAGTPAPQNQVLKLHANGFPNIILFCVLILPVSFDIRTLT